MSKRLLRSEVLNALSYSKEEGCFYLLKSHGRGRAGTRAGNTAKTGYRCLQINGKRVREHKLVWFMETGEWPPLLDHIDGDPTNSRIENLRPASHVTNGANSRKPLRNTSGFKGVYARKGRWFAKIVVFSRQIYLGQFATREEAHKAYSEGARQHYGEYARVA